MAQGVKRVAKTSALADLIPILLARKRDTCGGATKELNMVKESLDPYIMIDK